MVHHHHLIVIASLLIGSLGSEMAAAEPGFEPIFDGKTLQGWSGDPTLWSVQDGAIQLRRLNRVMPTTAIIAE